MRSIILSSIRRTLPAAALLLPLLALLVALAGPASGAHAATLGGLALTPQPSSDPALSISPAKQTVWVARGGVYHFDLAVKNAGATDTVVYLGASSVPGWKVRLSQDTAVVKARSSALIGVDIAVPLATTVDSARVDVTAKNQIQSVTASIGLVFGPTPTN